MLSDEQMHVVMVTLLMLAAVVLCVTADVTDNVRRHRNDVINDG